MEFKKYPHMNSKDFVKKIKRNAPVDEKFVVQEKIHGSNFSFWSDEKETLPGRRSSFLKQEENFYNYQIVFDKYHENMRQLFKSFDNAKVVVVCGELYGGVYPGMKTPVAALVQHEVLYCPHNDFIVFDMKVDDNYLSPHEVNKLCDKHNIPRLKILFEGSLDDCMKYPNDFTSLISDMHGLPKIDEINICEGTVIKPVIPRTMHNGSRVILKNKNKKFSEVKERVNKAKSSEIDNVISIMDSYVTKNRLKNVLSKVGLIGRDENSYEYFNSLKYELMRDVVRKFKEKDDFLNLREIYKPNKGQIHDEIWNSVKKMVDEYEIIVS